MSPLSSIWVLLAVLAFLGLLLQQTAACQFAVNCSMCIQTNSSCAWCSQTKFDGSSRCGTIQDLEQQGCSTNNIESPRSSVVFTENNEVTDGQTGSDAIQVQPQRVKLTLRPKEKKTVKLTFRAARNYPVDLYFLFDLSKTMQLHKEALAEFSVKLATEIGNISKNYQLGFGCFQDKVMDPFTITIPSKLENPCYQCDPPFGFIHKLPLTTNVQTFIDVVKNANSTGNVDAPEGGFDAIMQVAACPAKIGWRQQSRRLLIYSSDSGFHMAGDGRLAGIVRPNDGQCHLMPDGRNPEENNQDYPSVGQIAEKLREEDINVIFAIAKGIDPNVINHYHTLEKRLRGSSVERLDDNKNVVELVREKYEALISEVKMNVIKPTDVRVDLRSDCNRGTKVKRDTCDGLSIGRAVTFDVDILISECPAKEDRKKIIQISPQAINEKLTIEVDMICDCECEFTGEANSSLCSNGNGTLACGICQCNPGRHGKTCQCATVGTSDDITAQEDCKKDNVTCMNAGECKCGQCECNKGFSGKYCECRTSACDNLNCGGVERGTCQCGQCVCNEGYTGRYCECSQSTDACQSDADPNVLCSGAGKCECGRCNCYPGYIGNKCETCGTCPGACESHLPCAECVVELEASSETSVLDCAGACGMNIELVQDGDTRDDEWCSLPVQDGCQVVFRIEDRGDGNKTIKVLERKVCSQPVSLVPIIAGVIGGIVAIGLLLLLLWKLLTSFYDGIEYARFQEDCKKMKWAHEDNPIYKGATTTFHNPLLGNDQD